MVFKNKGDVQSCCNYGGIKLMNHIMKLWEKLLMFGYEERWWSMFRARASCWEITRQMFVFRVLLKYKEGQESYCLCGCIESLWWEGTVAPHEEITSSSEVWGQRDSGDVCSRNAKTMVWVRWETRDARKTQMLGFVWLSDSASFTVIQSVLTAEWHYVDRGENIHFICSSGNGSNISNIWKYFYLSGHVLQVLFLGPLMQLAMDCPWSFTDGIRVAFGEPTSCAVFYSWFMILDLFLNLVYTCCSRFFL